MKVAPITARVALSPVGRPAIHSAISAHDGVRPRPDGLNQKYGHTEGRWATALAGLASVRGRESRCDRVLETPDFSVSQRVEDEGHQLAGHRDPGLVLAACSAIRR